MAYRSCFVLALALSGSAAAAAQSVKLSGPMAPQVLADVTEYRITPDGSLVVYRRAASGNGPPAELLVGPADGSAPAVALTDMDAVGRVVTTFAISADGARVVFRAGELDGFTRTELYGVPIDASQPPVRLSDVGALGSVRDFAIDPQSANVLYVADQALDGVDELFSAPIDGTAPALRISGSMVAGGDVLVPPNGGQAFRFSPDGTRAVYVADQLIDEVFEIFSAPVDGSAAAVRLDRGLVTGGDVTEEFVISPDSLRVVYRADAVVNGRHQVYSAPIDGGVRPRRLSRQDEHFLRASDPRIAPDGQTVLYLSEGVLFRVPITGLLQDGHAVTPEVIQRRVSGALSAGEEVALYDFTPDGSRVVYRTAGSGSFDRRLFSVPLLDASAAVELSPPGADVGNYRVAPDGARVVFETDEHALFSVPIGGGPATDLEAVVDALTPPELTHNGNRVVFLGEDGQLYSVPADGGALPLRLNLPHPVDGTSVASFLVSPVEPRVLYRSNEHTHSADELFAVPANGSQLPTKLNAPLPLGPSGGDVLDFQLTGDGASVVYRADQDIDGLVELYGVPSAGAVPPSKLSDILHIGGDVHPGFRLFPDGQRVAFVSNREFLFLLYSAPVDGSAAPLTLTANSARQVFEPLQIAPDGSRAVYLSSQADPDEHDLFSVPTDGSLAAVQLNTGLPIWGEVGEDFRITPDSQRVVFVDGGFPSTNLGLYSALLTGSEDPLLLSPAIESNGSFQLTATGTHALLRQPQLRLFAASVDGSEPLQALSSGTVTTYVPRPTGLRALFTSNASSELFSVHVSDGQPALSLTGTSHDAIRVQIEMVGGAAYYIADGVIHGVPLSGAALPTPLSPALAPGSTLSTFEVSALGRVVYLVFEGSVTELYSVPTDGSRSATKLNAPLAIGGQVFSFEVSLDGSQVVYLADQDQDEVRELFVVPVAGGTPTQLNKPLVPGGDVLNGFLVGAGERVYYRADEDTDEVVELYMSNL